MHPDNAAAESFYSKFGFKKTGFVIGGEDAMGMTFRKNELPSGENTA